MLRIVETESRKLAEASEAVLNKLEEEVEGLEEKLNAKDVQIKEMRQMNEEIAAKYKQELYVLKQIKTKY